MTYIQSNKKNNILSLFLGLGFLVILAIVAEVSIYSQAVDFKHDIIKISSELENVKLKNSELKNSFYKLTDQASLDELARARGLVREENPKWVFALHY